MSIELSHEELIDLVCGTSPSYSILGSYISSNKGTFSDNFGWSWDKYKLSKLDDKELLATYKECKESWKK